MILPDLEQIYLDESPCGHISALQAVYRAGFQEGHKEAWHEVVKRNEDREKELREFGSNTDMPAIIRQAIGMGRTLK